MWLLSTDRAELCYFSSPENVTGGYAVLSHTWGHDEETFQSIQALTRQYGGRTRESPRSSGFLRSKVVRSCILAQEQGYRWIWNDTCCIDKTNSSELAEAIKSMFRWYSCAEICFAYLVDVPSDCELAAPGSAFRTSRWHSRGWTLQELIAPSRLLFVSKDWKVIGDKSQLSLLLEDVTGVWSKVLTHEVHYAAASVAQRMSWASRRSTSREEDEAYCLMGLFNLNMPTMYGEGRQAFQRLQHEIMKQTSDTSLFAWGSYIDSEFENVTPLDAGDIHPRFYTPFQNQLYLLAPSPKSFSPTPFRAQFVRHTSLQRSTLQSRGKQRNGMHSKPDPRASRYPFGRGFPRFSATNDGIKFHFPIIKSRGLTIAVLWCNTGREHIGLLLHRDCDDHRSKDSLQDNPSSREKYNTGYFFDRGSGVRRFSRLISLGRDLHNLRINGKEVRAPKWDDILIVESPPPTKKEVAPSVLYALQSLGTSSPADPPPFRLPLWLIGRLRAMGMELQPLFHPVQRHALSMSVEFVDTTNMEGIRLVFGTCEHHRDWPQAGRDGRDGGSGSGRRVHWAKAMPLYPESSHQRQSYNHVCSKHHVRDWPDLSKDFGDAKRSVRLSFFPQPGSSYTWVIHIQLEGRIYTGMKMRKVVDFPPRDLVGR